MRNVSRHQAPRCNAAIRSAPRRFSLCRRSARHPHRKTRTSLQLIATGIQIRRRWLQNGRSIVRIARKRLSTCPRTPLSPSLAFRPHMARQVKQAHASIVLVGDTDNDVVILQAPQDDLEIGEGHLRAHRKLARARRTMAKQPGDDLEFAGNEPQIQFRFNRGYIEYTPIHSTHYPAPELRLIFQQFQHFAIDSKIFRLSIQISENINR